MTKQYSLWRCAVTFTLLPRHTKTHRWPNVWGSVTTRLPPAGTSRPGEGGCCGKRRSLQHVIYVCADRLFLPPPPPLPPCCVPAFNWVRMRICASESTCGRAHVRCVSITRGTWKSFVATTPQGGCWSLSCGDGLFEGMIPED